jgi:hypothetical protein
MKAPPLITAVALAMAAPLASALDLPSLRLGNTPARSIALSPSLPGKSAYGECKAFALALDLKFKQANISSQVVGFEYEALGRRSELRGHAVVIFEDGGRTYVMDNQMSSPVWIKNSGSLAEKVAQITDLNTTVLRAWALNNPTAQSPQEPLAHLSSKAKDR